MLSFNALLTLRFPHFLFIFLLVQLFEVTLFQLFSISFTSEVQDRTVHANGVCMCVRGVAGVGIEYRPCLTELNSRTSAVTHMKEEWRGENKRREK